MRHLQELRKILVRTQQGAYEIHINNHPSLAPVDLSVSPHFNTTKRLPGTSQFVNKVRPKAVKA